MGAQLITRVFEVVSGVVTSLMGVLTNLFNNVVAIFYNAENGFTFIGTLLLIAVGVPLVYWGINFVIGLIKKIKAK